MKGPIGMPPKGLPPNRGMSPKSNGMNYKMNKKTVSPKINVKTTKITPAKQGLTFNKRMASPVYNDNNNNNNYNVRNKQTVQVFIKLFYMCLYYKNIFFCI